MKRTSGKTYLAKYSSSIKNRAEKVTCFFYCQFWLLGFVEYQLQSLSVVVFNVLVPSNEFVSSLILRHLSRQLQPPNSMLYMFPEKKQNYFALYTIISLLLCSFFSSFCLLKAPGLYLHIQLYCKTHLIAEDMLAMFTAAQYEHGSHSIDRYRCNLSLFIISSTHTHKTFKYIFLH